MSVRNKHHCRYCTTSICANTKKAAITCLAVIGMFHACTQTYRATNVGGFQQSYTARHTLMTVLYHSTRLDCSRCRQLLAYKTARCRIHFSFRLRLPWRTCRLYSTAQNISKLMLHSRSE